MVTYSETSKDRIWKALADSHRRHLLEILAQSPKKTGELVKAVPGMGRTGVLKHISVLESADLIRVRRDGRERWNAINPDPILTVCNSWVARHIKGVTSSIAALKQLAERADGPPQGDH